jgi:hypothetical protein
VSVIGAVVALAIGELGSLSSFAFFIAMETDVLLLDGVLDSASREMESLFFTSYCTMVSDVVGGVTSRGTFRNDAVSGAKGSAVFLALPSGIAVMSNPFSSDDDSIVELGMLGGKDALLIELTMNNNRGHEVERVVVKTSCQELSCDTKNKTTLCNARYRLLIQFIFIHNIYQYSFIIKIIFFCLTHSRSFKYLLLHE